VTKKILTVLVLALFVVLAGLAGLYFYIHTSVNKKNSVLSFIPPQTEFILRIKKTSVTSNRFINHQIVNDCYHFSEIRKYWTVIDSITSRNYKTSEILLKNTSYICMDSSSHYLILVDLDKKTNEHFIDQFLSASTSLKKIERFKEGYKAFYPMPDEPIYYFVKNNVFGLSKNAEYLKAAIINGAEEKVDEKIGSWDRTSSSDLSAWGKKGAEARVLRPLMVDGLLFGNWLDKLSDSFWFDIWVEEDKMTFKGTLEFDSLNTEAIKFTNNDIEYVSFFKSDTGVFQNKFYSYGVNDSLGTQQPLSFMYYTFTDTSGMQVQLLVSGNAIAADLFRGAMRDTSVQLITMADEKITEIAVMNREVVSKIWPFIPFDPGTGKIFGTIFNDYVFFTNSTEAMLSQAPHYPSGDFMKRKLDPADIIFSSEQIKLNRLYSVEYNYKKGKSRTISFTSTIKNIRKK
jgi:hypothetical protein